MVLMAGGYGSSGFLASAELYNPATGTFTLTGSLNTAREAHTATLLNNGMVLIAGGVNSSGSLASAELYQPGTLTPPNLISIEVTPAASTLSPGTTQQFIATGTFSDSSTEQLASVTWSSSNTAVAQISNDAGNHGAALAIAPGTVTITATAGSVSGSATLTVQPTGFVLTGSLNTARTEHTATLLNNGMVLIAGGGNSSGLPSQCGAVQSNDRDLHPHRQPEHRAYLSHGDAAEQWHGADCGRRSTALAAELYNPATGTFTYTGSLNTAREYPTATLLNNGMVLIAGGYNGRGAFIASAELYNPATGTFTYTGSLNTARYWHTATLLNNGMVLIAGGGFNRLPTQCGAVQSRDRDLHRHRQPEQQSFRAHGDAAEQRHGADCGRLQQFQRFRSECGAVQSGDRDLHRHRQPEHRALLAHGDAAEQRHGADRGRHQRH